METKDASDVSNYKATIHGSVSGKLDIKSRFVCGFKYSTDYATVKSGMNIICTANDGEFSSQLAKLNDGVTYYYVAYVKVGNTYYYGKENSFATVKSEDDAYNLSQEGKANCYIVDKIGTFKFDISNYEANSAFLLWDENGKDDITDVKLDGDYVYFTKTAFNKGNAMISIKDKNGAIVWSWLIWTTDTPQTISGWMDRNIGATSTEPNNPNVYGLLFTPGNPFPFPGPKYTETWSITETPSVPEGWYVADGYGFYKSSAMPSAATPMQLCSRTDVYGNSVYFRIGYSQIPYGYGLPSASYFQDLLGYEPIIKENGVYPAEGLYIPCISGGRPSSSYGEYLCSGIYNRTAVDTWTILFYDKVSSKSYCKGAEVLPIRCYSYK